MVLPSRAAIFVLAQPSVDQLRGLRFKNSGATRTALKKGAPRDEDARLRVATRIAKSSRSHLVEAGGGGFGVGVRAGFGF